MYKANRPFKEVYVILMDNGTYWVAGGMHWRDGMTTSSDLSSAKFLTKEEAHELAGKIPYKCEARPAYLILGVEGIEGNSEV